MRCTWLLVVLAVLPGLAGVACDDSEDSAAPAASASPESRLPEGLILASEPDGAQSVSNLRASAGDGETVVVRGVVGGREDPIAENRAILTLLDESVETCDRMETDDGCKTPWDACCTPQETIAANLATVQVVDGKGSPLRTSLRGVDRLAPLARVIVVGKYRPSPDGQAAVIDATGIYILN